MTDFFTSLVDRALDRTPVLERRQPTLFEPSAEMATGFSEQANTGRASLLQENEIVVDGGPVSHAPKAVVKNVSHTAQRTLPREKPESEPVEVLPSRRLRLHDPSRFKNDADEAQPATSPFATLKETHVEEPRREMTPTVVANPQENNVAPLTTIETIVERRVEREIINERSTDTPAIAEVHTVTQPQLQPKASSKTAAEQKQPAKAEVKSLRQPKEQTAIKPVTEKKAITRKDSTPILSALSRAESRQPTKQPAMPAIHVTIGRVEVRATPPAASKSRVAQPVGPKLTLEDYLRSRGEESK